MRIPLVEKNGGSKLHQPQYGTQQHAENPELRASEAVLGSHLTDLKSLSRINFEAAVGSLVYLALMVVCLVLNAIRTTNFYTGGDSGVFEYPLHFTEFWATCKLQ